MKRYSSERMRAAGNDVLLYEVTKLLDEANLAGLSELQPGEYISEARLILKNKSGYSSVKDVYVELVSIMRMQFGWRIRPILRLKYRRCAYDIWSELNLGKYG